MPPCPSPPLADRLFTLAPRPENVTGDEVLDRFLDYARDLGLELYPAQEEALLEVCAGKNVILGTPTGSGKSLVATAVHFLAMAKQARSFYTCPIKALVSEKFFALCRDFGPDNVGMMTGDATVNRDAPIICCTAEVLANMALREGRAADIGYVVMDEFHYYADRDRGVAWQIPLLTLPQATFLLMSATLGPTEYFEQCLTRLNGHPTAVVRSQQRPVPLDFYYSETPLHQCILELVEQGKYPIYLVNFTQRACAEEAQNLMSTDYCTKDEKRQIHDALVGVRWASPYGKRFQTFLRHGIGVHHAGLLPRYRLLVEKLAQKGHLKVICGTDTLGVGVNIPIRTVLFTRLCKYDGEKVGLLSVRDFQQISGRAGRKGFDVQGSVVAQAPEHVIENLRLDGRAASDPAKRRKVVHKKPPTKGFVNWNRATFERLIGAEPEPLVSRFKVTHGMLVNVLSRRAGGCKAMARVIRNSHERLPQKRAHGRTAVALFRSLADAGIVEIDPTNRSVVVNVDLQEDFSLHHALSLYLLETIGVLDRESPTYALDVLTLVESILEDPDFILGRQLDKLKTQKLAELKAAGVEYDQRIEELDKMEYPKPLCELVYSTFNAFAKKHPWVDADNIRPKSVAREMFETYQSFPDYIREYDLERAEGLLLRYLSDVYKTLVQTVPQPAKNDDVEEIVTYFGAIVRAVDSSLLDEWERMRGRALPGGEAAAGPGPENAPSDVLWDDKALTVLVRNAAFGLTRALARKDWEAAAAMVEPGEEPWTPVRLQKAMESFWATHTAVRTDPVARGPANLRIQKGDEVWKVEQAILDAEEDNDWVFRCDVALGPSREAGRPLLNLRHLGT
jgi:superfamily II RNA helicase